MSKVTVSKVSKSFGKTVALSGLNLEIAEGKFVSLLGPSGCGKTTALRIIAGLVRPDQGQVFFDGNDVTNSKTADRDIGMVFQAYSLFPNMTARENVEFGLQTRKLLNSEIKKRVDDIFGVIGLESQMSRYPHQLSGGQQQRVALARAIVIRPRLLLLDEPLSALDAQVRNQLRDEIRRVQNAFGITTLFVTHDQEEAMTVSDQVGVMSEGELIQFDSPQNIYLHPRDENIARFIGSMNELPGMVIGNQVEVLSQLMHIADGSKISGNNRAVKCLVRPEALQLCSPDGSPAQGQITEISFLGPYSVVKVKIERDIHVKAIVASSELNNLSVQSNIGLRLSGKSVLVVNR